MALMHLILAGDGWQIQHLVVAFLCTIVGQA